MSKNVAFITLGCAKNEADTRKMAYALCKHGFIVIDDVQDAAVDLIIVNTCSFIQSATEESIAAILDALELPSFQYGAKLIVAGCMPARYGQDLIGEFPEVARFVDCANEDNIASIVSEVLSVDEMPNYYEAALAEDTSVKQNIEHPYCAYIKISDGCDRWCSYCTIPIIRGRYHSFSQEQIFTDVEREVNRGAKEIVLIAQDTGRWGADLGNDKSLAGLIVFLADGFPDVRFRVMYIQPEGITNEFLDAMAHKSNICKYLDIPIQHVSANILRKMNRSGSAQEFVELFERVRSHVPGVALRTTLIAGFPGETEADFDELLDFVENCSLDYIGVFPYSREEGTKAFDLPNQVDEDERHFRAQRLRDMADAVCASNIASRIGKCAKVLVEGAEVDGQLFGRTEWQAPEVDGVTFLNAGQPGEFVEVVIEDTLFYDMEGSVYDGKR